MHFDIDEYSSPFYLLVNSTPCWECGQSCRVVGIAAEEGEPFMIHKVESMPEEFIAAIQRVHQSYVLRWSSDDDTFYYVNTCPCGSRFSDFYLFSRPSGAFFPRDEEEASAIEIYEFPFEGTFSFKAEYGLGTGSYILKHGTHMGKIP